MSAPATSQSASKKAYDFTVGDAIALIKEHTSLSYPSHPASSLRVVTWHTDAGKVQAMVLANAVASTPATSTSTSKKVQNKVLYRTEVTGDTAAALRQLLKGLEGMSRQKFGNAGAGQIV